MFRLFLLSPIFFSLRVRTENILPESLLTPEWLFFLLMSELFSVVLIIAADKWPQVP